jgi:predicted MFS family arabinose efflux permease
MEQALAFGLMNLTWATGQTLGNIGGSSLGEAAGDTFAYLLLSALCVVVFVALRARAPRPVTA